MRVLLLVVLIRHCSSSLATQFADYGYCSSPGQTVFPYTQTRENGPKRVPALHRSGYSRKSDYSSNHRARHEHRPEQADKPPSKARRRADKPAKRACSILVALEREHRDAGAVHALDLQGDAVGLDRIAGLGRAAEGAQDVAAYGVEVLVGEVYLEAVVHVRYGDAPIHGVEVVADALDGGLVLVELVLDLPD